MRINLMLVLCATNACVNSYSDVGVAHLGYSSEKTAGDTPNVDYVNGQPLEVWVEHYSVADRDPDHSCSVTVETGVIIIESELSLGRDPNDLRAPSVFSHCSSSALGGGTYEVSFGPSTETLVIPSSRPGIVLEGEDRE